MVIGLLLLAVAQDGGSCENCSVAGERVALCEPHQAEERVVLAREGKRVRSSNEAEAIAGLEAIAALTLAHPQAPSPRVVTALAEGLSSRNAPKVRVRAAELLGPPQHVGASLEALLPIFVRVDKDIGGIPDEETATLMRTTLELLDVAVTMLERMGSKDRRKLEDAKKEAAELTAKLAKATPLLEVRSALLRRLAAFPDDRVVRAILKSTSAGSLEVTEALLLLGSRPAVEHVLAVLGAWQDTKPGYEAAQIERHEARGRQLQQSLKDMATRRGLLPCPDPGGTPHVAWMEWWRSNASSFAESLPGAKTARLDPPAATPPSSR